MTVRDFAYATNDPRHNGTLLDDTGPWMFGLGTAHYEDRDDYAPDEGDEELHPGWYRALYPFDPEGTAEMALREDALVRILGRGGGVGWAVALRPEGGTHALVPESYLEFVRPAEDDDDEDITSLIAPLAVQ